MSNDDLRRKVRTIPDFPKPGILFYDITSLLQDSQGLRDTVDRMIEPWRMAKLDAVVAIDARGFILGSALAYKLGVGLALVRKKGKLPYKTEAVSYDLEYGSATVEMHVDAVAGGKRVLIVDDLLATGGTAAAAGSLVQKLGGRLLGYSFVLELGFLHGRQKLGSDRVESLIHVQG